MSDLNNEIEEQTPTLLQEESVSIPKKKKKLYIPVAILILLCAVVSVVFYPTITNAFAKLTMSPAKYYQLIEKSNQDKQIDKVSKSYGEYLDTYDKYVKDGMGSKMSLSATIDPSVATPLGLEGLGSIGITGESMFKDYKTQVDLGFVCNEINLTNMSMFMDVAKSEGYYLIPALNKAYLRIPYDQIYDNELGAYNPMDVYSFLDEKILSEEKFNSLSKKYLHLIISQLDKVTLTDKDSVTADGITQSYSKLSVDIDEKKALEINKSILTTASSDKELEEIVVNSKLLTSKEYQDGIASALEDITSQLEALTTQDNSVVVVMSIWVDNIGNIMGREFSVDGEPSFKMGYQKAIDGTKMGVKAWISEDNIDILTATGTLALKTSGVSGKINMNINQENAQPFNLTLNMENVTYKYKDGFTLLNGDFTFTSESNSAIKVVVNATSKDKHQSIVADIIQGTTTLSSITLDSSIIAYTDIKMPTDSDISYDLITEMDQYMATSDVKGFLESINEKIEIEYINQMIDNLILYSTY